MLLPGLKSRIHTALVSVAKEHASLGEITESKVLILTLEQQFLLLKLQVTFILFYVAIRLVWEFFF